MIKMQIQQRDEEEYDDQVFVVNRKMDALKSLVTQLERDVKKYVENSHIMQRIGISLFSVDRDLPLETFVEQLTQNVNDVLKFLE